MYVQFKGCPPNSSQHFALKNNLSVFNSILKRTICEAKIKYFGNLVHQYKNDIKMTWKSLKLYVNQAAKERN